MLVMYVEDHYEDQVFVRRVIEAMGHEVVEAGTGLDILEIAAERNPDLIIMDINLPGMNGLEVTAKLKEDKKLAHIPIVALTINLMKEDEQRCLEAGCDEYLPKPISVSALRKTIERYVPAAS